MMTMYYLMPGPYVYHEWEDPWFLENFPKAIGTQDYDERWELTMECAIYALEQAPYITLPASYIRVYWQPWIKGGYWGQRGLSYSDRVSPLSPLHR